MYAQYFGLRDNPFTITPNPRYLYLGARHSEALAHLIYGVTESSGFIQLTGEVGTGKTLLIRSLLEQLPEHVDVALIVNPQVTLAEFLQAICRELDVPVRQGASGAETSRMLNEKLLQAHADGQRVVLIVDEAQNLPRKLLELVRLLTNLETSTQKLLQIILVGQPELRDTLARRDLRQLAQRITGRYHLMPLGAAETRAYIQHRLKIAGAGGSIFTTGALRQLYRRSGGIPRLINILADLALLGAYAAEQRECNARLVRRAAREALPPPGRSKPRLRFAAAALAGVALALGGALTWHWNTTGSQAATIAQSKPARPAKAHDPIGDWLQNARTPADTDAAFSTLFTLWNAHYDADSATSACRQARANGLRCLYRKGEWRKLVAYDRPAILNLTLPDGAQYQAVLDKVGDGRATLRTGNATRTVSLAALRRDWDGDFLLLWRPPPASDGLLRQGMSGPAVGWLGDRLSQLDPTLFMAPGDTRYDAKLAGAVKDFQRAHGLTVDGIAGKRTLIELNGALKNAHVPRLQRQPDAIPGDAATALTRRSG